MTPSELVAIRVEELPALGRHLPGILGIFQHQPPRGAVRAFLDLVEELAHPRETG